MNNTYLKKKNTFLPGVPCFDGGSVGLEADEADWLILRGQASDWLILRRQASDWLNTGGQAYDWLNTGRQIHLTSRISRQRPKTILIFGFSLFFSRNFANSVDISKF